MNFSRLTKLSVSVLLLLSLTLIPSNALFQTPAERASDYSNNSIQPFQVAGDDPTNAISIDPVPWDNITYYNNTFPGPSTNGGYWFVVELGQNLLTGFYTFQVTFINFSLNFGFTVYDDSLQFFGSSISNPSNPGLSFLNSADMLGTYYIELLPFGDTGDFEFAVLDIGLDGDEAYNGMMVFSDTIVPGIIPGPGAINETWYQLDNLSTQFNTQFSLDADPSTNFDIFIYEYFSLDLLNSSQTNSYPEQALLDGSVSPILIEIKPISGEGNFTLSIKELIPPGFDEANAIPMVLNTPITREFPNPDDLFALYFSIDFGQNPTSYLLNLTGDPGSDYFAIVRDSDGRFVANAESLAYPKTAEIINAVGIHYIFVSRFDNVGNFTLLIQAFDPLGSLNNPMPIELDSQTFTPIPGPALDNSWYFIIDLTASSYRFTLTRFSSFLLQVSVIEADIFDSSGRLVGDLVADPVGTVLLLLSEDIYLINVKSDSQSASFGLEVTEVPVGSSIDNPYMPDGFTHSGTFENGFEEWVLFSLPTSEDLVTFSLSCGEDTFMGITAFGLNETRLADGKTTECSETSNPTITISNPPETVLIQVIASENTIPYTLTMDCDSCVDTPVLNPSFVWDIEGEEFGVTAQVEGECGIFYLITITYSWTNLPSKTVDTEISVEFQKGDSGDASSVFNDIGGNTFEASGSGSKVEDLEYYPKLSEDRFDHIFLAVVTIDSSKTEKSLDWIPECANPEEVDTRDTSRGRSISFDMGYFLLSAMMIAMVYRKKS